MDYYVDSVWGNDENPGTINFPWSTISKVTSNFFLPGDNIFFKCGGAWSEELRYYNSSGEKNNPITFGAYGNGKLPLMEDGIVLDGYQNPDLSYIVIEGLEVTSTTGRGIWNMRADWCAVCNCIVRDIAPGDKGLGVGIDFDGYAGDCKGALVKGNRVYNTADIGIQMENCHEDPVVRNNLVSECMGDAGISLIAYPELIRESGVLIPGLQGIDAGGKVHNNTIYKCGTGISVIKTAGWNFYNNTIEDGVDTDCGVRWWYDHKEHMHSLKWNKNKIINCSQLMLIGYDIDLIQEHDHNCYVGGVFNQLDPWVTLDFTGYREVTGQEKHSKEIIDHGYWD